jgi:acyl carrier protein
MVPEGWVVLDALPVTANGKLDRKSLPAPQMSQSLGEYAAPTTEVEKQLVIICADLLEVQETEISVLANFLQLGGHSILSMHLVSAIRAAFKVALPLSMVFHAQNLKQLAKEIEHFEDGLDAVFDITIKGYSSAQNMYDDEGTTSEFEL